MNQNNIDTFLTIVETRNITKTAESLFISQPTVSRRLRELEEEVGAQLIVRTKGVRQIELTSAGNRFIPIAQRYSDINKEMHAMITEKQKYYLKIGCTDTFNNAVMMPLYREVLEDEWRSNSLHVQTHYSRSLYSHVDKKEIDIGFVFHYLNYKNIVAEPILREQHYIVSLNKEGREVPEVIRTDDLDTEKEVFMSSEINYQNWHDQWVSRGRQPRVEVDSYALFANIIQSENAWGIVPASVVRRLQQDMPLAVSRIGNAVAPPERITYKIKRRDVPAQVEEAIAEFEARLETYLAAQDWTVMHP